MKRSKTNLRNILLGIGCCMSLFTPAWAADLKAGVGYIPTLADYSGKGPFVDLVKAIAGEYRDGTMQIQVYPFARSLKNVELGLEDFHVPMMLSPYVDVDKLPFRFVKKPMGVVCQVLYSRRIAPISKEQIDDALSEPVFPYRIEVIHGSKQFFNFPFPVGEAVYFDDGLLRVIKGKSDAFITAQEEGDAMLRNLAGKQHLHRSLLGCWDDLIVIPKGPKGDELDSILSDALTKLEASGRLKALRQKIHGPYQDWQP